MNTLYIFNSRILPSKHINSSLLILVPATLAMPATCLLCSPLSPLSLSPLSRPPNTYSPFSLSYRLYMCSVVRWSMEYEDVFWGDGGREEGDTDGDPGSGSLAVENGLLNWSDDVVDVVKKEWSWKTLCLAVILFFFGGLGTTSGWAVGGFLFPADVSSSYPLKKRDGWGSPYRGLPCL